MRNRMLIGLFVLCACLLSVAGIAGGAPDALGVTITVNTTTDEFGSGANCALREAIKTANGDANFGGCTRTTGGPVGDHIIVPAGTYVLTLAGTDEDAGATGDLDITDNVIISGTTASVSVVQGTAGWQDRLFHILTGTVTLKGLTIRDGNLLNGRAGAGVRTEPGTDTTLERVVVRLNSADGNAGGVLNRGTLTIILSTVSENQTLNATQGGGGIFNDDASVLRLLSTRVLTNTAYGDSGDGGGIYNDVNASLLVSDTLVGGNTADKSGSGVIFAEGGGIFSNAGQMTITHSTIRDNISRGTNAEGGGIVCTGQALIEYSLVANNTAVRHPDIFDDFPDGGGIYNNCDMTIRYSVISGNTAETGGLGGGIYHNANRLVVENSTVSGNRVNGGQLLPNLLGLGGGIYSSGELILVNTTISGNESESHGGGLYVFNPGATSAMLWNTTIAGNTSNADLTSGGAGGGIFVESGGVVTMTNSVLADNTEGGIGNHDDCDGYIRSLGYNLIQNSNIGCSTLGGGGSDLLGVGAQLGALAANGGPVAGSVTYNAFSSLRTHAPAVNSPLVDAGDPGVCHNQNGGLLTSDQRGYRRPVDGPDPDTITTCDIGAVEYIAAPASVAISGPTRSAVNAGKTFTATVSPAGATLPLTYTWEATDLGATTQAGQSIIATLIRTWTLPGVKTITVTAENDMGSVVDTQQITIPPPLFLPVIMR